MRKEFVVLMKKFRYDQMKGGWFVGNFEPSVFKTKNFEVGYLKHKKGDMWDKHYHKHATEINLIVRGRVKVNDEIYSKGDIFIEGKNIEVLRSGKQRKGLHPRFLEKIQGKKSTRDVPIGDGIMEEDYEKI